MLKKKLNNGVEIPVIGLGVFKTRDGQETTDSVNWAIEAGYRHIDTAKAYNNEKSVGEGIRKSGIAREELFITTKLWNEDIRQGNTREAFYRSLEALGTDYLDLYLIHWPAQGFSEAWKEMERLYKEGAVKAIGVSNFQDYHLKQLMETAEITPAVNQIECHPLLTQIPLRNYCRELGIACECWSPLGGTGGNLLQNQVIGTLAEKYGKSPAQIILRWDIEEDMITIPKSVHQDRIRSNMEVFDFELAPEDVECIRGLNEDRRVGPNPDTFDF